MGRTDGVTSIESELKLLNVARGSIQELREDYEDYLLSRRLTVWTAKHPRFDKMLRYCREHNQLTREVNALIQENVLLRKRIGELGG